MLIALDLDNTVLDWNAGYDRRALAFAELGLVQSADHDRFDLFYGLGEDGKKALLGIFDEPGFYADLDIYPGAVDAIKAIEKAGHEVIFCSAPWVTNTTCASDKYDWVAKHIGPEYANKLILAKNKSLVHADILIDDRPNLENDPRNLIIPTWKQIYYTQTYNKNLDGPRIDTWEDIDTVLHTIRSLERSPETVDA